MPKNKKLALKWLIQTHQILTNNDEVGIPILSIILCNTNQRLLNPLDKPNKLNLPLGWAELSQRKKFQLRF